MRVKIKITIEDLGELKGELVRIYSPILVEKLIKILPIESWATRHNGYICASIPLKTGAEKGRTEVKLGSIIYMPISNSICFTFNDIKTPMPVSLLGHITSNLYLLEKVRGGRRLKIEIEK